MRKRAGLELFATAVGTDAPDTFRPVSFEFFSTRAGRRFGITYELTFRDRWVLARVTVHDSAGESQIVGAQANTIPRSAAAANALTLASKPPMYYARTILALVIPVLMVITAIQIARSTMRRRWLWVLATLVGVGRVLLNWTTGAFAIQLLHLQVLGVGISRSGGPYVPWVLSLSLPAGAIVGQWRLRRREAAPAPPGDVESSLPARVR